MKYHYIEIPTHIKSHRAVYGKDAAEGWPGFGFVNKEDAADFIKEANAGRVLETCHPFHEEKCCGCIIVYSCRHGIALLCNECGERRLLETNDNGMIILAFTKKFE